MAQGIFIGIAIVIAVCSVFAIKAVKRRSAPTEFELAQDMRRFADGFFHAPPAEQTERVDIFRETAANYRRKGVSTRDYARSATLLDTTLAPEEQTLLRTVTRNFVAGD